jgi:hypothetical protein
MTIPTTAINLGILSISALLSMVMVPRGIFGTLLISDQHHGLIAAAQEILPVTEHFFCIHHLEGNVDINLRRHLATEDWQQFKNAFWAVYCAVSPEEFDKQWQALTTQFPAAKDYLDEELYPCRSQWAWAYTGYKFTCGVRTNGRVEGEN